MIYRATFKIQSKLQAMKHFAKIVDSLKSLTIFAKHFICDVWMFDWVLNTLLVCHLPYFF